MGEILRNAKLVDLDPPSVEEGDLRIDGDRIVARGPALPAQPGDIETDLSRKLVMPGLVCGHVHLYFSLARTSPQPQPQPKTYLEAVDRIWWRLDRALDPATVEVAAAAGGLEALFAGTTTVFDHHSSPSCIDGALTAVQRGLERVGLRGVLCYEVSDRMGPELAQASLRENERYAQAAVGRFRAMVGAHASFTLEEPTLLQACELAKRFHVGVHIHAAEDAFDDRDAQQRLQKPLSQRLVDAGVAGPLSIVAHGTQFAWEDLAALLQHGTWMCHLPRANMLSGLGYAPAGKFGPRTLLGTENLAPDMFREVRAAVERSSDAGTPLDPLRLLSAGHKLATQVFGRPIGLLREGAAADLLVLDYEPRTPLTGQTLARHVAWEMSARDVESVMVDGCWRLWARKPLKLEVREIADQSVAYAQALWERMAQL